MTDDSGLREKCMALVEERQLRADTFEKIAKEMAGADESWVNLREGVNAHRLRICAGQLFQLMESSCE